MPFAPAVCDRCQFVFPSRIELAAGNAVFEYLTARPCPKCGADGTIPDGTYSVFDGVLKVVATGSVSRDQLARLLAIVGNRSSSADTIARQIESEVPECSVLARYIPSGAAELAAYLAIVGALLMSVIEGCDRGGPSTINIEQVTNIIYER